MDAEVLAMNGRRPERSPSDNTTVPFRVERLRELESRRLDRGGLTRQARQAPSQAVLAHLLAEPRGPPLTSIRHDEDVRRRSRQTDSPAEDDGGQNDERLAGGPQRLPDPGAYLGRRLTAARHRAPPRTALR